MASGDIVPIELGLTDGDLVTLWAPRWRDGDDEWEAFLGHEDALYGFESVAELAAFIRTDSDNDLVDHPAWKVVAGLSAVELEPEDNFTFDLIGVPELVAGDPDAEIVAELRGHPRHGAQYRRGVRAGGGDQVLRLASGARRAAQRHQCLRRPRR